jgi:TolA-binding protein
MLHARICEKRHDYTQALTYLKDIYTKYSTDVLGDDAVFKTALIYENGLPDKDKAKEFYEKLIVDYPGSTYVQVARQRLRELTTAHSGTLP